MHALAAALAAPARLAREHRYRVRLFPERQREASPRPPRLRDVPSRRRRYPRRASRPPTTRTAARPARSTTRATTRTGTAPTLSAAVSTWRGTSARTGPGARRTPRASRRRRSVGTRGTRWRRRSTPGAIRGARARAREKAKTSGRTPNQRRVKLDTYRALSRAADEAYGGTVRQRRDAVERRTRIDRLADPRDPRGDGPRRDRRGAALSSPRRREKLSTDATMRWLFTPLTRAARGVDEWLNEDIRVTRGRGYEPYETYESRLSRTSLGGARRVRGVRVRRATRSCIDRTTIRTAIVR